MARLVIVDGVSVDIPLSGCLLLVKNIDKPGIIGQIGTLLGKGSINIAGMQVGRTQSGGEATTIISIDNCVAADVVKQIATLSGVTSVKYVAI